MGRTFTWIGAMLFALAAWLALPQAAHAGTVTSSGPIDVCVAPVRDGERFADLLTDRIALSCDRRQTDFGSGDFWAASRRPLSLPATGDFRLRVASLWQSRTTIGIVHADGHVAWITADSRALSRHIHVGAVAGFALPAWRAPVTRIIWRIDGAANRRGVLNGVRLMTEEESARADMLMTGLFAAFGGLAFALLVFNLSLWGALRHRFQLAYCLMLAMLLLYALSTSGALAALVPDIDNNNRLRINYLTLATAAAAALLFARTYFEARVFEGWVGRAVDGIVVMLIAVGIGVAAFAHWQMTALDLLYSMACLSLIAAIPFIVWRAWVVKSRFLWLFALAWTAPIVMAATRILQSLNLLEWNFWLDNSTLMAMALEALLSSFAIAYRIRLLSAERDQAIAEAAVDRMLAATDPLTGLLNRRAFLNDAVGRNTPQQLILLDIDHFKGVNETLGHDGGDEVLRNVARLLRDRCPEGGLAARLGGEEFALVVPATTPIDPARLLADLRATRMPFDLRVTASIGTCTGPIRHEVDWKHLYKRADAALFDAKAMGRDRARLATALASAA